MLLIGTIIVIAAILCILGYLYRDQLKQLWQKHTKKIIAIVISSSVASAGLMGIPNNPFEDVDAILITDESMYAEYGFYDVVDPVVYEKEVLCTGHMPLILNLTFSQDTHFSTIDSANFISALKLNQNRNIHNFEYKILVQREIEEQVPDVRIINVTWNQYNNSTKEYENITTQNESCFGEKTIITKKWVWEDLHDFSGIIKYKDTVIVDIIGHMSATTGKRSVDVVPVVNYHGNEKAFPEFAWWNSNWLYYKSITFDTSQIPDELHNVPILINVTDADLAAHVAQASGEDIAFVDDDNSTQFYHEIEEWDSGTGYLAAWVNVTTISNTENIIGIYYGNAGCADQQDAANTWNDNYTCVLHMNQDPTGGADSFIDSTGNGHHGTPVNLDADDSITGIASTCIDFDGGNERMSLDSSAATFGTYSEGTIEGWAFSSGGGYMATLNDFDDAADFLNLGISGGSDAINGDLGDGGAWRFLGSDTTVDNGNWFHHVYGSDGSDNIFYINGLEESVTFTDGSDDGTWYDDTDGGEDTYSLAALYRGSSIYSDYTIDEFRVSTTVRSANYYLLLYNNMVNASDGGFYTLGSEQTDEPSSTIHLNGLPGNNITFAGEPGDTVWCNSSGDHHETMEIYLDLNATMNITMINITIGDLEHASYQNINASNLTLYASVDNATFGVPTHDPSGNGNGIFCDGGCNITLNSTTWNAGTMGTDPFTIENDTTDSIYVRVKCTIPASISNSGTWTNYSCKVYFVGNQWW